MATLPIRTLTKPSTLNGLSNGNLPSSILTKIGVGNAIMEITAARAFIAMFAAARAAGFIIREVGDYRPFLEQFNLFLSRYKPVSYEVWLATPKEHRKTWNNAGIYGFNSIYWIKKDFSLATAATPGDSNHGWGLALDIAEEYDGDPSPDGIRTAFVNWLVANALTYGICAELQSEVWHWRYYTGDAIPAAVLAFEQGNLPPPPEPDPTPPPSTGDRVISVTAEMTEVKLGSNSTDVKRLQCLLRDFFGQAMVTIDGQFGPKTEEGLKNVQRALSLKDDGICGPATWKKMLELP